MNEPDTTNEQKNTPTRRPKNKKTGSPSVKPASQVSTMKEVLTQIDRLRQRAIILDALANTCVELFAQTEHQEPKYLIMQPNGNAVVADFDLVLDLNHELHVAAHVARERLRRLMETVVHAPMTPLPHLTDEVEEPTPGEGPPIDPAETVIRNPSQNRL